MVVPVAFQDQNFRHLSGTPDKIKENLHSQLVVEQAQKTAIPETI